MLARLTDAVVSGDTGAEVEILRALAVAEQGFPDQKGRVVNHVQRQAFEQLRSIYSDVARSNYGQSPSNSTRSRGSSTVLQRPSILKPLPP
jgi:hypothetical protein